MILKGWQVFGIIPSLVWLVCGGAGGYFATRGDVMAAWQVAAIPVVAAWGIAYLVIGVAMMVRRE